MTSDADDSSGKAARVTHAREYGGEEIDIDIKRSARECPAPC